MGAFVGSSVVLLLLLGLVWGPWYRREREGRPAPSGVAHVLSRRPAWRIAAVLMTALIIASADFGIAFVVYRLLE